MTDVVLIPGWGFCSTVFTPLHQILKSRLGCQLYDYPGYEMNTEAVYPDNIHALVKDFVLRYCAQKKHLIGWSFGGTMALLAAYWYPERIKTVITLTSLPCYAEDPMWPGISSSVFKWLEGGVRRNLQKTMQQFVKWQYGHKAHEPCVKDQTELCNTLCCKPESLLKSLQHVSTIDIRHQVPLLQMPCFHIFGNHDRVLLPAAQQAACRTYGKAQVCVMEGGHCLFWDHPRPIADKISRILLT